MLKVLALACCAALGSAVEVPATVLIAVDGDTIAVSSPSGSPLKVRLLYIDTPESKGNSHGAATPEGRLAAQFTDYQARPGTRVVLWGPGDELEQDLYKRSLAVVIFEDGDTLQERIIAAGWSPLWEKYGKANAKWRNTWLATEEKAKQEKAGAWATNPTYMTDKKNETTAKKAERAD